MYMSKNLLGAESSPYLLQHAENPVHWYPWGPEALDRARRDDKPIFLSIGYSACHWCHVMAHESFEDENIAKVMNESFINIKVDREERPDIDAIYQSACQMATGQGGWPLSVFLTPDQKPFYVGTYFPVLDGYGRPGFGSILRQLSLAWEEKPADIKKSADKFLQKIKFSAQPPSHSTLDMTILDEAAFTLLSMGDPIYGGFGDAPKFPNMANVSFLLRYATISNVSKFNKFGLDSLRQMAKGGIFDQIGGGFHRYSTDRMWLVPHFEKMLYDNALIPITYAEAYQITKDEFYLDIMKKTLNFVLNEMTSPAGGFYSALDADSEGEEGRFYVWSKSEINEILNDDAQLFCLYYDVTEGGNWEGTNILRNNIRLSTAARACNVSENEAKRIICASERRLYEIRSLRVRPGLDDKILTSWNAMMISAFARGYRVSHEPKYLDAAKKATNFIINKMMDKQGLFRTYKETATIRGFLEDYSYMASALLDIFEESPDVKYLKTAEYLGECILEHFWDGENNFFMTPDNHESLIVRPQHNYDIPVPSGGSMATMVLIKLYHLTGRTKFLDAAKKYMGMRLQEAADNPFAYCYLLSAAYMYMLKPIEITILNTKDNSIKDEIRTRFIPNGIVVSVQNEGQAQNLSKYPFFAGKVFSDKTQVFVCKDMTCTPPLTTLPEILDKL